MYTYQVTISFVGGYDFVDCYLAATRGEAISKARKLRKNNASYRDKRIESIATKRV